MLSVVGLNHHTANVATRETVSVKDATHLQEVYCKIAKLVPDVAEMAVLSTCNRTEMYLYTSPGLSSLDLITLFNRVFESTLGQDVLYVLHDSACAQHLFRVASGLDSMVIGETEILGQVKDASHSAGTHIQTVIGELFKRAISTAKEVHSHVSLSDGKRSVARLAADLVIQAQEDQPRIVLIGSGKISVAFGRYLSDKGFHNGVIITRDLVHGQTLASELAWNVAHYADLDRELADAQWVVAATTTDRYLVTEQQMSSQCHKVSFIDLSVPRAIEPQLANHSASFYDIDQFTNVVQKTFENKLAKVSDSMVIVEQEVHAFMAWLHQRSVVPMIAKLRERVQIEKDRIAHSLLAKLPVYDDRVRNEINAHLGRLANTVIHHPIVALKANVHSAQVVSAFQVLFDLENKETLT